jgi:uncharacterized glyoxalase superfamily protein PhnB
VTDPAFAITGHATAARGVAIAVPIADRPYGMRDFSVDDPDGHRLDFGQGHSEN